MDKVCQSFFKILMHLFLFNYHSVSKKFSFLHVKECKNSKEEIRTNNMSNYFRFLPTIDYQLKVANTTANKKNPLAIVPHKSSVVAFITIEQLKIATTKSKLLLILRINLITLFIPL